MLGAHRAGIKHIVIPAENDADLEDVPDEVRQLLTFHPVATLPEVLLIAMADDLVRVVRGKALATAPDELKAIE